MKRLTLSSWLCVVVLLTGLIASVAPAPAPAQAVTLDDLEVVVGVQSLGGNVKWPQVATMDDRVAAVGSFATDSSNTNSVARLFVKNESGSFPTSVWTSGDLGKKNDFGTAGVAYDTNGNIYVAATYPGQSKIIVTKHNSSGNLLTSWILNVGPWATNPALAVGKGASANRLMLIWRDDNGQDKPAPYIAWLNNLAGGSFTSPLRLTDGNDKSSAWAPGIAPAPNGDFAFAWGRYDPRPMVIQTAIWRASLSSTSSPVSNRSLITGQSGAALHTPSVAYSKTGGALYVAYRGDTGAWVAEFTPQSGSNSPSIGSTRNLLPTSQQVDGRVNVTSDDNGAIHFAFSAGPESARGQRQIYYGVLDGNSIVGQKNLTNSGGTGAFQNPFAAASRGSSNSYNHVVYEWHDGGVAKLRVVTFKAPPPFGATPVLSVAKVGNTTTTVDVAWTNIQGRPNRIRYGWQFGSTAGTTEWETGVSPDYFVSHTPGSTSRSATLTIPTDWQTPLRCETRTFRSDFKKTEVESSYPDIETWTTSSTDTIITDYGVVASTALTTTTAISRTTLNTAVTTMAIWGDRVTARPRGLLDTGTSPDGTMVTTITRNKTLECTRLWNVRAGADDAGADSATAVILRGGTAVSPPELYTRYLAAPGLSDDIDSSLPVSLRIDDDLGNSRYNSHTFLVDNSAPDVSAVSASPTFTATASPMGDIVQDIELDLSNVDLSDTVAVLVTASFVEDESVLLSNTRAWKAFRADQVIDGTILRLDGWSMANAIEARTATAATTYNLNALATAPENGSVYITLMDEAGNLSEPIVLTFPLEWQRVELRLPLTLR